MTYAVRMGDLDFQLYPAYCDNKDIAYTFDLAKKLFNDAFYGRFACTYAMRSMRQTINGVIAVHPMIIESLYLNAHIRLCRIFDKDSKSIDIYTLFNRMQVIHDAFDTHDFRFDAMNNAYSMFLERQKALRQKCIKNSIDNLRILRNRLYAHSDRDWFSKTSELLNNYNVDMETMLRIFDEVGKACLIVIGLFTIDILSFKWSPMLFEGLCIWNVANKR